MTDTQHSYNKGIHLLKRIGNTIIAFDNVAIDDRAWNGFEENTCIICDTEFENENIHKTEQNHVLNLIQRNLEFGDDNSVYRKV